MLRYLRSAARLWWGALVTSWFWLVGIVVLSLLPPLVKLHIGGDEETVTAYLVIFSVAVGIGSALAALIARGRIVLSRATRSAATGRRWLMGGNGDLDGVIAKRLSLPYRSGERDGMVKVKRQRTADCVVGGFRYASKGRGVGSLLLGLYDEDGLLHHVGFTSSLRGDQRKGLAERLERLIEPPGFTGRAPGGPSRWSTERSAEWQPLRPELVVEVGYDHVSGERFRHGTRFLRWRPDKAPRQCRMSQLR